MIQRKLIHRSAGVGRLNCQPTRVRAHGSSTAMPIYAVLNLSRSNGKAAASQRVFNKDPSDETLVSREKRHTQHGLPTTKPEELDKTIANLQKLNAELQAEMQQVVFGLTGVMETMQKATSQNTPPTNGSARNSSNGKASTPTQQQRKTVGGNKTVSGATTSDVSVTSATSSSVHHHHASSCVVQHPGAVCCTHIAAKTDEVTGTTSVTIKTVAKHTEDADHAGNDLTPTDMAALAAQALLAAATDHFRSCTQVIHSHTHPAQRSAQHAQLCNILENGEVLYTERNTPSQFGHPSYILQLRDPATGRRLKAVFKPRVEGDAGGWHRAPMEYVAYRLNLLLGLDLVPPVAYRTTPTRLCIDGEEIVCEEGAVMYFVQDADTLCNFPSETWGVDKDVLLSDTRILDVLLHNSDRHHGHFMLGRHWCRGSWQGERWVGEKRPVLIDHAASFRKDAHVSMEHENAFQTGSVQCVSAHTYLRLRFLDAAAVSQEFSNFLSDEEVVGLVQRRNYVLRYLDKNVEKEGYQTVVRDQVSS